MADNSICHACDSLREQIYEDMYGLLAQFTQHIESVIRSQRTVTVKVYPEDSGASTENHPLPFINGILPVRKRRRSVQPPDQRLQLSSPSTFAIADPRPQPDPDPIPPRRVTPRASATVQESRNELNLSSASTYAMVTKTEPLSIADFTMNNAPITAVVEMDYQPEVDEESAAVQSLLPVESVIADAQLGLSEPEQSASSSISIPTDVKYHCLQKARRSSRAKDYVAYALNLCRQVFTEEEWVNTRVNGSGNSEMDPVRLQAVKDEVIRQFGLKSEPDINKKWHEITLAIASNARGIRFRQRKRVAQLFSLRGY